MSAFLVVIIVFGMGVFVGRWSVSEEL